jgi:hypothetical protein
MPWTKLAQQDDLDALELRAPRLLQEDSSGTDREVGHADAANYDVLLLELFNIIIDTGSSYLKMALSDDGGSGYDAALSGVVYGAATSDAAFHDIVGSGAFAILTAGDVGEFPLASNPINGWVKISRGNVAGSTPTTYTGQMVYTVTGPQIAAVSLGGQGSNEEVNHVRVSTSSGTITGGTARLWGLPKGS